MSNRNTGSLGLVKQAFALGLISISLQIIYARMAVSFAGGNEIYLSIFFLLWLIFTGSGALLIKKANSNRLFFALGVLSVLLPIFFYISPRLFGFLPGQLVPPYAYLITTVIVLLPVCVLNGGLFSSIAYRVKAESSSGRTYLSEALGSVTGGILLTIYYYFGGGDYAMLVGLAIFSTVFMPMRWLAVKIIVFVLIIFTIFTGWGNQIEKILLRVHYQPYKYQHSVSGRLVRYDAVGVGEMISLYSGGMKVADFPPPIESRELFYWPYLVKPDTKNIAIIGGENAGLEKVIPDSISRIYIYPDYRWRELIDPQYLPLLADSRYSDPIAYLKKYEQKYDMIILNLGELLSLYDKRLETDYFLSLCRANLKPDGILSVSVPGYHGNWRADLRYRLAGIYESLKRLFPEVGVIPGDRLIFIAGTFIDLSPDNLMTNYISLNIDSPYFTEALINNSRNDYNLRQTMRQLDGNVKDRDRYDIGYGLSYYLAQFAGESRLLKLFTPVSLGAIILLVVLFTITLARFTQDRMVSLLGILYFGAASFVLEVMAMYRIQLSGGYLYIILGLVIGLFMLGMSFGSFVALRVTCLQRNVGLVKLTPAIAPIAFVVISGIFLLTPDSEFISLIITALAGATGGFGYTINAREFDYRPGLPYGIDLLGGLLGTLAGLGVLLGLLGVGTLIVVIIGLGLILLATNKAGLRY